MACYVIGIGGTGAKCVEALIHLSAAGLMPDKKNAQGHVIGQEDLYVAFVDPDGSNGSLERARITLTQYDMCKSTKYGTTELFKTPLLFVPNHDTWSPFTEKPQPQLDAFFEYNSLSSNPANKPTAHLFDVLYDPEEKSTNLEMGFRGHPSIGAAVLSSTLKFGKTEPWETFRNRIRQDVAGEGARVILIGSIFGGTGAAGLPTIARLINNELRIAEVENSRLGGILVLPYFSFDPVTSGGMRADSENFLLSTQAALKYYHQQADQQMGLGIFKTMYTFGEAQLSPVKVSSLGSRTQRNEPHIIELYAALACLDFFDGAHNAAGYNMVARASQGELNWSDLPYDDKKVLKDKVGQLTRFAFAYLSSYYEALSGVEKKGGGYRVPWYVNFFQHIKLDIKEHQPVLDNMRDYCRGYLLWLAHIGSSARNLKSELINHNAFSVMGRDKEGKPELQIRSDFDLDNFDNLILPEGKKSPNGLHHLWEDMCSASTRDKNAVGVGKFFHALYDKCGE